MKYITVHSVKVDIGLKDVLLPNKVYLSCSSYPSTFNASWSITILMIILYPYIKAFPKLVKFKQIVLREMYKVDFIREIIIVKGSKMFKNTVRWIKGDPTFKDYPSAILIFSMIFIYGSLAFSIWNFNKEDIIKDNVNKTEKNITKPTTAKVLSPHIPTVIVADDINETNIAKSVDVNETNVTKTSEVNKTVEIVPVVVKDVVKRSVKRSPPKIPTKNITTNNSIEDDCEDCKVVLPPRNNPKIIKSIKRMYPKSSIKDIFKELNK